MILSGKLTFNAVAVKHIEVEKVTKTSLISLSDKDVQSEKLSDFVDHPLQGEVVGIGENVTSCEVGDIVLLKLQGGYAPNPYMINDKGTIYSIYNETDVVLVRKP